jgi:protein ImuB
LPTWLLKEPLALHMRGNRPHYQGPLRLLVGPQRLETGWWLDESGQGDAPAAGLAVRDYFIAHSAQAGLLWIYRQRLGASNAPQWFLQGLYA